jgi:ferredoxin
MIRLVVDEQLCVGHGCCAEVAPQWFELDERGIAHVLVEEIPDEEDPGAQRAMLSCPSEAIYLRRS